MNRTTSWIVATVVVLLAAVLMSVAGYRLLTPAAPGEHGVADFVAEEDLSPAAAMPPAGSWRIDCGRNTGGMHNADNLVASPG